MALDKDNCKAPVNELQLCVFAIGVLSLQRALDHVVPLPDEMGAMRGREAVRAALHDGVRLAVQGAARGEVLDALPDERARSVAVALAGRDFGRDGG